VVSNSTSDQRRFGYCSETHAALHLATRAGLISTREAIELAELVQPHTPIAERLAKAAKAIAALPDSIRHYVDQAKRAHGGDK